MGIGQHTLNTMSLIGPLMLLQPQIWYKPTYIH